MLINANIFETLRETNKTYFITAICGKTTALNN